MQGTPWGLLELESNGSNVFQEVFHVDQVVPSLPHSCVFSCDFANWWLWTTCHREHNTSKQSKLVSFRLKVPNYVPLGLSTWKGNLILVILPLFATIFEESHKKSHEKIFKHLGQHEILLGTHWNHSIPVLRAPKGCPALEQFWFFYFDPPTEHSTEHKNLITK